MATLPIEGQCTMEDPKVASDIQHFNNCFTCNYEAGCAFAAQVNQKLSSEDRYKAARKLHVVILLFLTFMVVEIVGGLKANSLSLLSDAAHLLTVIASFVISLVSAWSSGWKATTRQSYGFSRLEVLGALVTVQTTWMLCGILMYEAVDRAMQPHARIDGKLMLCIAAFGFFINLAMSVWFGRLGQGAGLGKCHNRGHELEEEEEEDEEEGIKLIPTASNFETTPTQIRSREVENWTQQNMSIQGAQLHPVFDLIQSMALMIAAAILWGRPDWVIVDIMCRFSCSVLLLWATLPMLRRVVIILMESTPSEIDAAQLGNGLLNLQGVFGLHDLHVWAISADKTLLSCHVTADVGSESNELLQKLRRYCEEKYDIGHVTIQIEHQ